MCFFFLKMLITSLSYSLLLVASFGLPPMICPCCSDILSQFFWLWRNRPQLHPVPSKEHQVFRNPLCSRSKLLTLHRLKAHSRKREIPQALHNFHSRQQSSFHYHHKLVSVLCIWALRSHFSLFQTFHVQNSPRNLALLPDVLAKGSKIQR